MSLRVARNPRITFWVLAAGVTSYSLLQSMTVPALARIQQEFDSDASSTSWVVTAFLLTAASATPIGGRLGDSFGKRRVFVCSLLALSVGAFAASFATSIGVLIAARVVQGLGGAAIPLSFAILRDELPPRLLPNAIAVITSLLAVGFGAGLVIAGPIIDSLGYRSLFLIPGLISGAAALCARWVIRESPSPTRDRVPLTPALLFTGWLAGLLLAVSKAPSWGWTSVPALASLACACVLVLLWVLAEWRAAIPMIDLRMMALRGVWASNFVAFLVGMATYALWAFLPQFMQTPTDSGYGFGVSMTVSGLLLLPSAVGSFVGGFFAMRMSARTGVRVAITSGCLTTSAALSMWTLWHDHPWQAALAGGLVGLGTGVVMACLANVVVASVPAGQTGVAAGMNANIRNVGGAVGAAVMASIVTAHLATSGFTSERGYTVGFAFLAGAGVLAAMAGITIPRGRRSADHPYSDGAGHLKVQVSGSQSTS